MLVRPFGSRAWRPRGRSAFSSVRSCLARHSSETAPFDYQAPGTLREAIDLLASNPEACVIAGGQSLMPVLAFRLATPSRLVNLQRLPGLANIAVIGATMRAPEFSGVLQSRVP